MKGALVPLASLTDAAGCDLRTLRRRLRRLDERLGGTLLVQYAEGGTVYADVAVLRKHVPALVRTDDEEPTEDPVTAGVRAMLREVAELKSMVREMQVNLDTVRHTLG